MKTLNAEITEQDKENIISGINIGVAIGLMLAENKDAGLSLYKELVQPADNENVLEEYKNSEVISARNLYSQKDWQSAIAKYKEIFACSKLEEVDFINLITCLGRLKQVDIALDYIKQYESYAEDKNRANYVIADLLFFQLGIIPEAIERYEKYVQTNQTDALTYNTLGHLYSKYYKDKFLDKQLEYFLKAYNLLPNSRVYTRNVILIYDRLCDYENEQKFYEHLFKINPTNEDYFDYGCFLIKQGNFKEGFEYLKYRFKREKDPALYPPMLPMDKLLAKKEDIEGHTILVQCEQGFGDSIMFVRYVNELAKIAKKVIFIVQDNLISLFKSSGINAELYGVDSDFSQFDYDYHLPLLNLPALLDAESTSIPHKDGYLRVNDDKIKEFEQKYIKKSDKLKIGIAFSGHANSKDMNRDIPLQEFLPIITMAEAEIYILQKEDNNGQVALLPNGAKVHNISKHFENFEDTASAIMNMDLIITTDNVILNLAGALGKRTFGLFNRFAEWRWFDLGEDVAWYSSVKPYQALSQDSWTIPIEEIKVKIKQLSL